METVFFTTLLLITFKISLCFSEILEELTEEDIYPGREVKCTAEEKRCFQHGRLLNKEDGTCYILGTRGPCLIREFYLDKRTLLESGQFAGKCVYHPIGNMKGEMQNEACEQICKSCDSKCVEGRNFFGDSTCECSNSTSSRKKILQPEVDGFCRVPDFRTATESPFLTVVDTSGNVFCSEEDFKCYRNWEVYWQGDGNCYELLQQGPCKKGESLVMDEGEYNTSRRLTPVCTPQPCSAGYVLMRYNGKCQQENDVKIELCSGREVSTDMFGKSGCGHTITLPSYVYVDGKCYFHTFTGVVASITASKLCSVSNIYGCPLDVIIPTPDLPEVH